MSEVGETSKFNKSSLHLGKMPSHSQFEFFADEICRLYNNCFCERVGEYEDFPALFENITSERSFVSLTHAPEVIVGLKSNQVIERETAPLHLVYMLHGTANLAYRDEKYQTREGGLFLCDTSQTFELEYRQDSRLHRTLTISLRAEDFQDTDVRKRLVSEKIFSQHRLSPLLRMSMNLLANSIKTSNTQECEVLTNYVESLISLIAQDEEDPAKQRLTDNQIFHLIDMEVNISLSAPNLTIEMLAHRLKITVKRIQRIMQGRQMTFSDFVREKRLQHGFSQLQNPVYATKSIAEIAWECGYSEQASFHRAFKKAFDKTPAETRRLSLNNNDDQ